MSKEAFEYSDLDAILAEFRGDSEAPAPAAPKAPPAPAAAREELYEEPAPVEKLPPEEDVPPEQDAPEVDCRVYFVSTGTKPRIGQVVMVDIIDNLDCDLMGNMVN